MRRAVAGVATLVAALAASGLGALLGEFSGRQASEPLGARLGAQNTPGPTGVLVIHPDDCRSVWRFLDLLARPQAWKRMPVSVIVLRADSAASPNWRDDLPEPLRGVPATRLNQHAAQALRPLGVLAAPSVLVFRAGALTAIERTPLDPNSYIDLGRRLEGRPPLPQEAVP